MMTDIAVPARGADQTSTIGASVADTTPSAGTRGLADIAVERRLASARPRLLSLAHRRGVAPDAADDVMQETLLTALRALGALRYPERMDPWLARRALAAPSAPAWR